jgi:5-methylcytosine-specific restriction enzyme subunit McrC
VTARQDLPPIVLREWVPIPVALNPVDADYLARHLSSRITVARALTGPGYVLNSNQFVGVVMLPSGRRLECRPKVSVGTLFSMLAVAYDLDVPLGDEAAGLDAFDQLLAFVVNHFVGLVDARLTAGMFRDYVEVEDNLLAVRGRIAVADDVRRNAILRHRTWCRYTEFTHDVPDNQIIRQVVHLLTGWPLPPRLVGRLRALDAMMGNITPTSFSADVLDRFRYDRMKEGYRTIHSYCRLFLDGLSLENRRGATDFRTFLIDMNALFERFVARSITRRLPRPLTLHEQFGTPLDETRQVGMSIDLLLRHAGVPVLVADPKYKPVQSKGRSPADVYQMLAYCTAMGVSTAVLIYPAERRGGANELPPILVRNSDVRVLAITVDLSGDAHSVGWAMDRLTDRLIREASQHVSVLDAARRGTIVRLA